MILHFWHAPDLRRSPLSSLYLTHSILNFGLGLVGIFVPVYIFNLTGNFFYLPAFYALASLTAVLIFVFGASFLARLGVTRLVLFSNLVRILNLLLLLLASQNSVLIFAAAFFEGLIYPTYWVAYHTIFAARGHDGSYGREIGWMGIFSHSAAALAPLIGGLAVALFGFPALYGLGMIVIFLSSFPIFFAGDHLGFHPLKPLEVIRGALAKEWRPLLAGLSAMRLEIVFTSLFLPLFIFTVLGSYTALGGIVTVKLAVAVLVIMLAGSVVDRRGSRRVFPFAAGALSLYWLLLNFARSILSLTALNSYLGMLGPFYGISADSLYYSIAKRDPYGAVIKRELIIHASVILWCGLGALMWLLFPANWPILFIPAAIGPLVAIALVKAK